MPLRFERQRGSTVQYDESTGQVFAETTVSMQSMVSTWTIESRGRAEDPRQYRNPGPGASSLRAAALRSCVWNIDGFEPETFTEAEPEPIQWPLGKIIYQKLKETDTLTARSWGLFRTAFPEDAPRKHAIKIFGGRGTVPVRLPSIVSYLSRLTFTCLTVLSLRNLRLRAEDLNTLLDAPNLAVLDLEHIPRERDSEIDDRFIRNWGRAVRERETFQKLRVLLLRGFTIDLDHTLRCLTDFPTLYLVNIDSWHASLDNKDATEGQIFDNGNWRYMPTDVEKSRSGHTHPGTIWARPGITTSRKLSMLYHFAGNLFQEAPPLATDESFITIDYGDSYSSSSNTSRSSWFVRVMPAKPEVGLNVGEKRPDESNDSKDNAERKRRKVKTGKQKDIGSLLGGFL